MVVSSAGCILTRDLPDPALDIPEGYKAARLTRADAPPTLDWWRGFRSPELTTLMEEAQTVNLDVAAATARFVQADAQARVAGAVLLPSLSGTGQQTYSRSSGSSSSGLSNGGREVVNYQSSLSASYELDFWGKNRDAAQAAEETAIATRFDRDVVALTALVSVANAYFQVLASQDRLRTAERNIASAQRILDAIKQRLSAGTGTDLDVAQQEAVLANQRAAVPTLRQTLAQNVNALATLVAIRETTNRLRLQREVVAASRRAFQLAEQQLRAGTANIVTVLNTQLTLFQAEDSLSQAQLARLLAIVSLYQALGGGWEPRMERPVNAL